MFFKLFRAAKSIPTEQQKLDALRYQNADNPLMQLHCDRMQAALTKR
jgi:hypothetical protein